MNLRRQSHITPDLHMQIYLNLIESLIDSKHASF
jgi:hypothetical protein